MTRTRQQAEAELASAEAELRAIFGTKKPGRRELVDRINNLRAELGIVRPASLEYEITAADPDDN